MIKWYFKCWTEQNRTEQKICLLSNMATCNISPVGFLFRQTNVWETRITGMQHIKHKNIYKYQRNHANKMWECKGKISCKHVKDNTSNINKFSYKKLNKPKAQRKAKSINTQRPIFCHICKYIYIATYIQKKTKMHKNPLRPPQRALMPKRK